MMITVWIHAYIKLEIVMFIVLFVKLASCVTTTLYHNNLSC